MKMETKIPFERITGKIFLIRKEKVTLNLNLAKLYDVETRVPLQFVRRNFERFSVDFMFQINEREFKILRSLIVTSSWGGRRCQPFVSTVQSVALLSRMVKVNISIMKAFVHLRNFLQGGKQLSWKLKKLKRETKSKLKEQEKQIQLIFEAMKELITGKAKSKNPISFKVISE